MPRILITGASRGIGLALTKEYSARGWDVLAACRTPDQAEALQALASQPNGNVTAHRLDVVDHGSIDALAETLAGTPIDVVCNNAGIGGGPAAQAGAQWGAQSGGVDFERWRLVLETNLLGAMKTALAFLPHVEAGAQKKIVSISSSLGSISATRGGNYAYRSSKAALNMAMRSLAMDLKKHGIIVGLLSPGIVDTDFTRGARVEKISAEESARGLAGIIDALTLEQSGDFIRHSGETVPW